MQDSGSVESSPTRLFAHAIMPPSGRQARGLFFEGPESSHLFRVHTGWDLAWERVGSPALLSTYLR